jgi:DNA-binding NarL/FixJ family response regulator
MKTRVCIFDDNTKILESFAIMMDVSEQIELVGSFADCSDVVRKVKDCQAEVVIMDIEIPPSTGIEAVKALRNVDQNIPVVMFTIFEDNDRIFDSICAGANGYLLKKTDPEKLIGFIEEVKHGGSPMSPSIARKVLDKFQRISQPSPNENYALTQREKEILKLLTRGLSYKMIAAECSISFETVRTHIKNIYAKLHVASMTEAVAKAIHERIV